MGKCENCGEWNTLIEEIEESIGKNAIAKSVGKGKILQTQNLNEIISGEKQKRISTGIADLDNVLGGGILPAGVVDCWPAGNWKEHPFDASFIMCCSTQKSFVCIWGRIC